MSTFSNEICESKADKRLNFPTFFYDNELNE